MKTTSAKFCALTCVLVVFLTFILSNTVIADPASRVARISYTNGIVSLLPAGTTKWVKAKLNRPLILGDSLWLDTNARIELQLGLATLRAGEQTNLKILNFNNELAQFQLTEGTLVLSITRLKPKQRYEVNTPNLALSIQTRGYYRIDVEKNSTTVTVRKGTATIYGEKAALKISAGKSCQFKGRNLQGYICNAIGPIDEFDRWSLERDRRAQKTAIKHVSKAMIGYEDLADHGQWKSVKKYGYVWVPDRVETDWVPYRDGHWVWIRGWGWTWVDDQPWGFAPFHYGRWVFIERRWAWVPGPVAAEPLYAPALVAFVGGRNFIVAEDTVGIAWFPLGPGEAYIPPYQVSRNYFTQINVSNTIINQTYVTNIYQNPNTVINYQNLAIGNAVTAVPTQAFVQSQPVEEAYVPVTEKNLANVPVTPVAAIAPEETSVLGGEKPTEAQPSKTIEDKPVLVKTEPPPAPVPFSEEQELLTKNPGEPLTAEEAQNMQPKKPGEETQVQLVDPQQTPEPVKETDQALPAKEAQPKEETQPAEPAQAPQESQPQEEAQPAEPVQAPQESQPQEEAQPAEPVQAPQESQPQEEAQPAEPVQTPQESQPQEEAQPAEPVQAPQESQPQEEPQPAEPVQAPQESQPQEEAQPAEPVQAPQESQPSQGIQPPEPMQAPQESQPSQGVQPPEPMQAPQESQPSQGVQPPEPMQAPEKTQSPEGAQPAKPDKDNQQPN
ncbi:DUF6600 domain-containing protein [Legionella oakridgensis]|uniref:DUF6600 domain-containing protein n=4 Tax=Legionella oakridgensis TaxID=29423 RepID=UPI00072EF794|nr:DUF6600 domain-containing protein [Legionella oakridgensis]